MESKILIKLFSFIVSPVFSIVLLPNRFNRRSNLGLDRMTAFAEVRLLGTCQEMMTRFTELHPQASERSSNLDG